MNRFKQVYFLRRTIQSLPLVHRKAGPTSTTLHDIDCNGSQGFWPYSKGRVAHLEFLHKLSGILIWILNRPPLAELVRTRSTPYRVVTRRGFFSFIMDDIFFNHLLVYKRQDWCAMSMACGYVRRMAGTQTFIGRLFRTLWRYGVFFMLTFDWIGDWDHKLVCFACSTELIHLFLICVFHIFVWLFLSF